ncbi:MAG: LuxR C-terminal-related transcriptional regulator, partial [Clostridia bacterium]
QEQRRFLYGVAPYESFTVDMARVLTGDPDIVQIMEELRTRGNFIRREPSGAYCIFPPLFHDYLIERRTRLWTQEERCSNDENAGLYYELNGDFTNALACYELAHSVERIAHLLIRNAENNPGNAHFLQTERYYRALPEDIVLASPALMSAMCMLCSSCYQPQESERWLDALEAFCHNADNSRKDRAFASSKLWYLRIALPHRGTGGIQKLLLSAAGMMKAHELVLQKFSVTGAIPSIMNGGKDFAFWSRHDRLLYQTFRGVVERVLQKDGIGLAQIALGESLFMKNGAENPGEIVMLFHTGICNAEASGSIETTFAGVGLFVRLMVAQGQIEAAMQYLEAFSARITDPSQNMIMGNLCALQTRIALWMGETARAVRWAQKEVSEEAEGHFHITCRYRMLVKARCHLAVGEAQKALSILAVLREYAIRYTRPQVQLETDALLAICMHRMRDERWREYLQSALALSRKYGFVQYLAEEGTALLPLLQEIQFKPTTDFDARLLADVAEYARVYPNYMQGENGLQALRNVDITILRYLCKGMRNEEIAEAMHLSANTVKTYLKNIYATLGVHSRVEAVQIAQRLWR